MKQRALGKTGLTVGEIGFGAWAIGGEAYGPTDDATSLAALRRAVEVGVTFFDTADVYGKGRSEVLLGKALAREKVVIATKVGWDWSGAERVQNFTPEHIKRAHEASMRRLGRIDLYQLHNPPAAVMRDAVAVMRKLARFVGASVRGPEEAMAAIDAGVDTLQLVYSYLDRRHEGAVMRRAREAGVGVIAREPLARGLMAGKFRADAPPKDDARGVWKGAEWTRRIAEVEEFRSLVRPGLPLAQAALKYVLAQPAVSVAIPGAKTPAQVEDNAAASDGWYDVFEGAGGDA